MREIKFRVWNKTVKQMWSWDVMYRNRTMALRKDIGSKDFMVIPCSEEHVIMQFTGLKDKNDKDIYEGDIFVFDLDKKNPKVIKIENGAVSNWSLFHFGHNGKVIGNIHENKDLMRTHSVSNAIKLN